MSIVQRDEDGWSEGPNHEGFAAEPLQAFQNGKGFVPLAIAGQGVGMDGGRDVEIRCAPNKVLGERRAALGLSIEGENQSAEEKTAFVLGKEGETLLNLIDASCGVAGKLMGPSQVGMKPGRK